MTKKYTRKNNKRRVKRGGDIESGTIEDITPIKNIPPDPERFKKYDDEIRAELSKPISSKDATAFFEGPTPEQRQKIEKEMMSTEDPLNKDPFDREELTIFSKKGGRRTRRKRKTKRKNSRHKRR